MQKGASFNLEAVKAQIEKARGGARPVAAVGFGRPIPE